VSSFTRASGTSSCLDPLPTPPQDPAGGPEPVVVALVPVDLGPVPWATCLALDAAGETVGVLELGPEDRARFRPRVPRSRASAP
jgi:hypothetical protein